MRTDELLQGWSDGSISADELRELTAKLAEPEHQNALLEDWLLESALPDRLPSASVAALPEALLTSPLPKVAQRMEPPQMKKRTGWLSWRPLAATAVVLLAAGWWVQYEGFHGEVARFGALQDCRWVDAKLTVAPGDGIRRGQRVELASGRVEIAFRSGAEVVLVGPCIFDVESAMGGFLTLGQMKTRAATPDSKGFTVRTRTARVVDVGTEFVTSAGADGLSRVDVTSGEVFVHVNGQKNPQHLHKGDALSVEAGKAQIMVRIESGDGSPAFRFPTIEPPSSSDAADVSRGQACARIIRGELAPLSGDVTKLFDGKGQSSADAPQESVFFAANVFGQILLDLGALKRVTKVNTFSWHRNRGRDDDHVRATQKFALYGFAGDTPQALDQSSASQGWELIGRVNTDEFFNVGEPRSRPEQQASSITAAGGTIGRYRYMLWDIRPSPNAWGAKEDNTLYGEFDVYAQ
jgi:hypothetical protein